jgi:beta-mannosidase
MAPYQDYHKYQARFVSEFGMQSHPSLALLESVVPEDERFAQSRTIMWHNKAGSGMPDGHRRLAVYQADTLRASENLAEQVYATQFVQAEAMRYAYQDFRHRWQHAGARAVGGALVWQLNDCWPVTSWALIDSAGVVKPAWHTIRRALAPVAAALRLDNDRAQAWIMSDKDHVAPLRLTLTVCSLLGQLLHTAQVTLDATANGSTDAEFALPEFHQPVVAQLCVYPPDAAPDTAPIACDTAWPEPYKFHHLAPANVAIERDTTTNTLLIRTKHPVKGLWLAAPGLHFEDNFLDLMPGQSQRIAVRGELASPITISALDQTMRCA